MVKVNEQLLIASTTDQFSYLDTWAPSHRTQQRSACLAAARLPEVWPGNYTCSKHIYCLASTLSITMWWWVLLSVCYKLLHGLLDFSGTPLHVLFKRKWTVLCVIWQCLWIRKKTIGALCTVLPLLPAGLFSPMLKGIKVNCPCQYYAVTPLMLVQMPKHRGW
jgi:hypothetical protein